MFPSHAHRQNVSEVKSNEDQTIPSEEYWNTSEDVPRTSKNLDGN